MGGRSGTTINVSSRAATTRRAGVGTRGTFSPPFGQFTFVAPYGTGKSSDKLHYLPS